MKKWAMFKMTRKSTIMKKLNESMWDLPSPATMTYFWNFGSILGLCLITQLITGIFLTFHYSSLSSSSFESVINLMRDTWGGWMFRLTHMNGASVFFMMIFLHLSRGVFYKSSSNKPTWMTGVTIMMILMGISFLGYVLPWGQMSYWAVAVITNLLTVVPLVGKDLTSWIWGGFSVGSPTLTRFYSLHFILPFILSALAMLHLSALHKNGSSNSIGMKSNLDKLEFHPYFTTKDILLLFLILIMSISLSYYAPHVLSDPLNNVPSNPMQTPAHIKPEWYFLTSYAILRSLPNKTMGVMALLASILIFATFPMFNYKFSTKFMAIRNMLFWGTISTFLLLAIMGSMTAEPPFIQMSKTLSYIYFCLLIIINL